MEAATALGAAGHGLDSDWTDNWLTDEGWATGAPTGAAPRDHKIDEAKDWLRAFFKQNPGDTYYERQLAILFEEHFFHWITTKALHELVAEEILAADLVSLPGLFDIRFYRLPRHRYWRRQAAEIQKLIREFSEPGFTQALGNQGEMLFDAALPRGGFMPVARDVRSFGGKDWTKTGHNLDRVVVRDGHHYGVEIKNTLPYIPPDELQVKLDMCTFLDLRPLFIARMHPRNYIEAIRSTGGYALVVKHQLYPFGYADLARRVRERLGLPVDCPRAIYDGTIQRFLNWHLAHL